MFSPVLTGLVLFSLTSAYPSLKLLTDSKKWEDGEVDEASEQTGTEVEVHGGSLLYNTICGKTREAIGAKLSPNADFGKKGNKCISTAEGLTNADGKIALIWPNKFNHYVVNMTALHFSDPWKCLPKLDNAFCKNTREKNCRGCVRTPTTCLDNCLTLDYLEKTLNLADEEMKLSVLEGAMWSKSSKTLITSRGMVLPQDWPEDLVALLKLKPKSNAGTGDGDNDYAAGGLLYGTKCKAGLVVQGGVVNQALDAENKKPLIINVGWQTYSCKEEKCLQAATDSNKLSDGATAMSTKYGKPLYAKCTETNAVKVLYCYISVCSSKYAFFGTECGSVQTLGEATKGIFWGVTDTHVYLRYTPGTIRAEIKSMVEPNFCATMPGAGQMWKSAKMMKFSKFSGMP